MPLRLNLGAGDAPLAGFENLDLKTGHTIYPLPHADGTVDEIRASHVLEHFSHREIRAVLKDWVRALKIDGVLKIAVPDFEKIAHGYLSGVKDEWQGYLMGGHVDAADRHGAIFDAASLSAHLVDAGLRAIEPWTSEQRDCASLPVSLNLQGRKAFRVVAVMSVPRLGFMDNFASAFQALMPLGIPLLRGGGVFWGAVMERTIEKAIADHRPHAVLTIDYDSVYGSADVVGLIDIMKARPNIAALAALQQARGMTGPLMQLVDDQGRVRSGVVREELDGQTIRARTAHFGLTLLRTSMLSALQKPWFCGVPASDGTWGEGRVDDDIHFWRRVEAAGLELHVACRIPIGHLELLVRWPDQNLMPIHQETIDYFENGKPKEAWQ